MSEQLSNQTNHCAPSDCMDFINKTTKNNKQTGKAKLNNKQTKKWIDTQTNTQTQKNQLSDTQKISKQMQQANAKINNKCLAQA